MLEPPDDPAEEAENAPGIPFRKRHATQEQAHVTLVRGPHVGWGILRCSHRLLDDFSQKIKGCGGNRQAFVTWRHWHWDCGLTGIRGPGGEFVKADGDRLAQIHRGLLGGGGDFDEQMAVRKVVTGKAVLLRAKDEGCAAAAGDFILEDGSKRAQGNRRLPRPAASERCRAGHETAIRYSFGKTGTLGRPFQHLGCANGGSGFAPMGCEGRNHGQARESKIGHGAGRGSNVKGIARRDQHHGEAVALG